MTLDDLISGCVVQVHTNNGFGTGFFVAESTVLTCAHVAAEQDEVRIVWGGTEYVGVVVTRRPATRGTGRYHGVPDIAVIQLPDRIEHPCVWLAEPSPRPADGTQVTAFGFSRNTLAAPDIGRDVRRLTISGLLADDCLRVTQDSVPYGMSGSPVVDPDSRRVAGFVKASVDSSGVLSAGGWIVSVATLNRHLPDLFAANRRACATWRDSIDPGLRYLEELAVKDEPPVVEVESEWTPFHYLDPRRRIVDFLHRPELDKLEEWCRPGSTQRVRLVCGPGGSGKTRLSVELVKRIRRMPDWVAIRIRRADVDLDELIPTLNGRKVLLCLEDGEEWAYELPRLLKIKQQANLRLLLLARTYGAWWGRLSAEGPVVNPDAMHLAPLGEEFDRVTILRQAYRDFRREIAPGAPADTPSVLVDAAPDAANALELLAAALAVVLHCRDNDGQPPDEIRLKGSLVGLLEYQRSWWERWVYSIGHEGRIDERDFSSKVLLMPALYLAADHEQARLALEQVLAGSGFADDVPGKVAATLAKVWPPPRRTDLQQYWDPLRPDRLRETLVLQVLGEADDQETAAELISRIFREKVDEAQAEHALTVLTQAERATTDDELRRRVRTCISTLLDHRPEAFLTAGVSVATGLNEPSSLIELIRAASARADEQTLRRAAVMIPQHNNALAALEAQLWQRRADKLRESSRNLTVAQRLAVAEQYRWQTHAHVRAEENAAALGAIKQSIELYSSVVVSAGRAEFIEDYAATLELAADVAMRAGQHEEALRHIQHVTDRYRDLDDDGAIQRTLRFQGALLQEMGRHQEAAEVLAEAKKHGLAYKSQVDKWFSEFLLSTDKKEAQPYEGPRPTLDDATLQLVLPIGHFAGPMYTAVGAGAPESFEVRFADGVFSLDAEKYAMWAVSHGDPNVVSNQMPTTREVAEYGAKAAGLAEPGPVFDKLVEDGLLMEVGLDTDQAREFACRHRIVPLALGLGNSPQNPGEFQIGLPNAARVSVGYDVYHMWLFTHRAPNLWKALLTIADEARQANEEQGGDVRLVEDPNALLSGLLRALQVLISTSCVFIDRCD